MCQCHVYIPIKSLLIEWLDEAESASAQKIFISESGDCPGIGADNVKART